MKLVLMILLLIASIVLIASILFQSGNSAGLSGLMITYFRNEEGIAPSSNQMILRRPLFSRIIVSKVPFTRCICLRCSRPLWARYVRLKDHLR